MLIFHPLLGLAGSLLRPVFFDVSKSETSTGGVSGSGVLRVNVPRDLRGRSEIIVFVSDKPVLGMSESTCGWVVGEYVVRWLMGFKNVLVEFNHMSLVCILAVVLSFLVSHVHNVHEYTNNMICVMYSV